MTGHIFPRTGDEGISFNSTEIGSETCQLLWGWDDLPIKSMALWWLISTTAPLPCLMFSSPWSSKEAPIRWPTFTINHAGILEYSNKKKPIYNIAHKQFSIKQNRDFPNAKHAHLNYEGLFYNLGRLGSCVCVFRVCILSSVIRFRFHQPQSKVKQQRIRIKIHRLAAGNHGRV